MVIGELIRRERHGAGLTQEQLADRVGVKKAVVSHWESGLRMPARENLQKLGETLGINPGTLLEMVARRDARPSPQHRSERPVKLNSTAADRFAAMAGMLTDPRVREILELFGMLEDYQRENLMYVVRGAAKLARQDNPGGKPVGRDEPLGTS